MLGNNVASAFQNVFPYFFEIDSISHRCLYAVTESTELIQVFRVASLIAREAAGPRVGARPPQSPASCFTSWSTAWPPLLTPSSPTGARSRSPSAWTRPRSLQGSATVRERDRPVPATRDRKSTRLNSSH